MDPRELFAPAAFPDLVLALVAGLFGLVVGSFANVVIHRLPDRAADPAAEAPLWRSIGRAWTRVRRPRRSQCPRCAAPIRARDNLPVLSFLLLCGRCRDCGAPISWRYPAVEVGNGLLWGGLALSYGPSPAALVVMLLATALLALALIDLELQLLPDAITLPATAFGLGLAALASAGWFASWPLTLFESGAAAAGGYLAFWGIAAAWRRLRGVEALGQGDWKMAAMLGAFLGWQKLLLTVFVASLAGSLVGGALILSRRGGSQSRLPLGSFLGLAGIATLFAGDPLLAWYRSLFDV